MKKTARSRNIDTVFVLIIFSVFAFSVLLVLMLSAGVYRNISDMSRESENERTALSYIRTKMRNLDSIDAFEIVQFGGVPALSLTETIGQTRFQTVIYTYDGWLCELFVESLAGFTPGDGLKVSPADDLRFEQADDGLLRIGSGDLQVLLSPRSSRSSASAATGGDSR